MNIIEACKDEKLFLDYLDNDLSTWQPWLAALRVVYGLHPPKWRPRGRKLIEQCTGRDVDQLPTVGFDVALFLTGRRSGKSRIAAVIAAYEAILAGREKKLKKGETGVVAVVSPTTKQSRIVKKYIRAIFDTPLLKQEVLRDTQNGFELKNGIQVEILAGDWRTIRGYTIIAAIIDELCFFGVDAEAKVKSDTELIRAIEPGLKTIGGKLIGISSPYAKKGWCYQQYKRSFGNNDGRVLVWNCPSRTMNATLPQKVVDDAMAEDLASAKSEYLGEFRDDVGQYLPRDVIERLVVDGRTRIEPEPKTTYYAFADLSGGRGDDAALAIGHREGRVVVLDALYRYAAPFNPYDVISQMMQQLKRYSVRRVVGDNYAAEFCVSGFKAYGMPYEKSPLPKSGLYLELLPRLCSSEIELLDDERLVTQLASLERRTRSGGKDMVDHPAGGMDDMANAVAGLAVVASKRKTIVGALN